MRRLLIVAALFLGWGRASAASMEEEARALSADPDGPSLRYGWAGSLRGRMSVLVPLVGDFETEGFVLVFQPLLEIHNKIGSGTPVPHEYWRGRASLELSRRWTLTSSVGPEAVIGLQIEHESAHRSVLPSEPSVLRFAEREDFAFQYENDVGVRGALHWPLPSGTLFAVTNHRFHFATCTIYDSTCDDVQVGGYTYDLSLELGLDSASRADPRAPTLHWFGSGYLQVILESEKTLVERKLVLEGGVRLPSEHAGELYLVASIQSGDVGVRRRDRDVQFGVFLGWAP